MGEILHTQSGKRSLLREHHTIGRQAGTVDTWVSNPMVSRIHASLTWKGGAWNLRDLSTNGTWLNESRVPGNQDIVVATGDRINFGDQSDSIWSLSDDNEPQPMLRGVTGDVEDILLIDNTFVPNEQDPDFYMAYSVSRQCWTCAAIDGADAALLERTIENGDLISAKGCSWEAVITETHAATIFEHAGIAAINDIAFMFQVSLDEENTHVEIRQNGATLDLGERAHHYLLMHLARERAKQREEGLDESSEGWIENELLSRQLGLDETGINLHVFRARKQLAASISNGVEGTDLIERMKGKVRFGCPNFTIVKGGTVLCESRAK